jgi:crotonobetainyl-CoA:carnitine CoA-transferase CaiB-like acyl-CoA transferase
MVVTLRRNENAVRVMGDPIVLEGSDRANYAFPPELGQDTVSILTEILGFDQEHIDDLINRGIVSRSSVA